MKRKRERNEKENVFFHGNIKLDHRLNVVAKNNIENSHSSTQQTNKHGNDDNVWSISLI